MISIKLLLLSIFGTIMFGIIDGVFFFIVDEELVKYIERLSFFDTVSSQLFIGGLSAAISILFASIIEHFISKYYKLYQNAFLDSFGILVGTFLMILSYKLYLFIGNKKHKKTKKIVKYYF